MSGRCYSEDCGGTNDVDEDNVCTYCGQCVECGNVVGAQGHEPGCGEPPNPYLRLRLRVEELQARAHRKADKHRDPHYGAQANAYKRVLKLIDKMARGAR